MVCVSKHLDRVLAREMAGVIVVFLRLPEPFIFISLYLLSSHMMQRVNPLKPHGKY
jgi:hypothetical protein